ncbi:MAG: DUF523 domain-containing protein [candidate division Zixibacteria bacterium]|nr:DUF523 domain-containing protein [candidate division Zixibacteria bacterium]
MAETIIISACLLGVKCRFDGDTMLDKRVANAAKGYSVISVCPEVLGGLNIPRPPAEVSDGDGADVLEGRSRVIQLKDQKDVTANYIEGAEKVMEQIRDKKIKFAIFKERSPSCGVSNIYRDGELVAGVGVTTAALKRENIKVYSEESPEILKLQEKNDT